MLEIVLNYLPILGISIVVNILLGMYKNIGINKEIFELKKLISGIIKGIIVGLSFVGLSYCFDKTGTIINIGQFEFDPEMIMTSAITIYMGKAIITLGNILGIKASVKESSNQPLEQFDPLDIEV